MCGDVELLYQRVVIAHVSSTSRQRAFKSKLAQMHGAVTGKNPASRQGSLDEFCIFLSD